MSSKAKSFSQLSDTPEPGSRSDFALKNGIDNLRVAVKVASVDGRKVGSNKISHTEVGWVSGSTGRLGGHPDLKKPTALRGVAGVWDCESSDHIRGCDGACFHAVGSLAGAGG